jgi:hypothetical protein
LNKKYSDKAKANINQKFLLYSIEIENEIISYAEIKKKI